MDRQGYWRANFFTKYGSILLFAYKKLQGIESMAQQPHGKKNGDGNERKQEDEE